MLCIPTDKTPIGLNIFFLKVLNIKYVKKKKKLLFCEFVVDLSTV